MSSVFDFGDPRRDRFDFDGDGKLDIIEKVHKEVERQRIINEINAKDDPPEIDWDDDDDDDDDDWDDDDWDDDSDWDDDDDYDDDDEWDNHFYFPGIRLSVNYNDLPDNSPKAKQPNPAHEFYKSKEFLSDRGIILYSKAIKAHFDLPVDIPDETDTPHTSFRNIIMTLFEHDPDFAIKVWVWCLDFFKTYYPKPNAANYHTHGSILHISAYPGKFRVALAEYIKSDPSFTSKKIAKHPEIFNYITEIVLYLLKSGIAEQSVCLIQKALYNTEWNTQKRVDFINDCIQSASDGKEVETMRAFRSCVVPLLESHTDRVIHDKTQKWIREMDSYIKDTEQTSDRYKFAGSNEWRKKYKSECNSAISPLHYTSEDRYLAAVNKQKYLWRKNCPPNEYGISPESFETRSAYDDAVFRAYARAAGIGFAKPSDKRSSSPNYDSIKKSYAESDDQKYAWRRYCRSNRFGITPDSFETRADYDAAVNKAYEEAAKEEINQKKAAQADKTIYSFCKVASDGLSGSPLYYFPGDLDVHVGDKVVIPYGADNAEFQGIVISTGECYASAFHCPVSRIKKIVSVIKK